jgi:uncharacterized protein (TIGR03089 family)
VSDSERLPALVHDLLVRRTAIAGAQPLLVHVDDATGTRVELSASSLTNTVAKASALLADEAGGSLALAIPPHWIGAGLALAAWHVALTVCGELEDATVAVVGPAALESDPEVSATVYVSRLHPFGLPFDATTELPWYATDLAPALREGPDRLGPPSLASSIPLRLTTGDVSEPELIAAAASFAGELEPGSTLLSALPFDEVRGLLAATLVPLLSGGSTVLVTGTTDPTRLAAIAATERATTTWTPA